MKQIITDSNGDFKGFERRIEEYAAQQGTFGVIGDIISLSLLKNKLEICFKALQSTMDYSIFQTEMSYEERVEQILMKMKERGDCDFGYSLIKLDLP